MAVTVAVAAVARKTRGQPEAAPGVPSWAAVKMGRAVATAAGWQRGLPCAGLMVKGLGLAVCENQPADQPVMRRVVMAVAAVGPMVWQEGVPLGPGLPVGQLRPNWQIAPELAQYPSVLSSPQGLALIRSLKYLRHLALDPVLLVAPHLVPGGQADSPSPQMKERSLALDVGQIVVESARIP